jgi:hypothetical protein
MATYKGPASLRPRCTRSGSSVAAIPVYQSYYCAASSNLFINASVYIFEYIGSILGPLVQDVQLKSGPLTKP